MLNCPSGPAILSSRMILDQDRSFSKIRACQHPKRQAHRLSQMITLCWKGLTTCNSFVIEDTVIYSIPKWRRLRKCSAGHVGVALSARRRCVGSCGSRARRCRSPGSSFSIWKKSCSNKRLKCSLYSGLHFFASEE